MINNDETKDKIELDEYNSFIMNVGVYDGKHYIVPLSYGMDVLVSTQERLKQFNVSGNNGETLTYSNVSVKFSPFLIQQRITALFQMTVIPVYGLITLCSFLADL